MKCILIATTSLVAASTAFAQQADQDATIYNNAEAGLQTEMQTQRDANTWDATGMDRPPYTDDHELIDTGVYGADGERLGTVERVRLSADGEVEAVVVEHGGILEIGGAERLIEAGNYTIDTTDGDARIQVAYDEASFEALPEFDEDLASNYPLSSADQVGDAATVGEFDEDYDDDEFDVAEDVTEPEDGYQVGEDRGDDEYETADAGDDVFDNDLPPYTDDHELVDTDVIGADGTELGVVERVRFSSTGEIDAIVVEHGGALDAGGREVLIETSDYSLATIDGESRIRLTHDEAAFMALPDFDERLASDYPLSSVEAATEPFEDGEDDAAARDMTDERDDDWEVAEGTRDTTGDLQRETRTAWSDTDRGIAEFTEDHELVDRDVYGSDGRKLGEVERVRVSGTGEVEAVIVRHGGIFGIGSREILVEAGHYSLGTVEGETQVRLDYDETSFKALPDFDEDEYMTEQRVGARERMSEDPTPPVADRYAAQARDDQAELARTARQSEADTERETRTAWNEMDMDGDDNPYTDSHELIDVEVYGSDGANVGEVERVRLSATGEVEAIVIETGGIADVGGREVLIEASDYSMATVDGEARITLPYDQAGFDALPDFDERLASDYPLSSDDFGDDDVDLGDGSR